MSEPRLLHPGDLPELLALSAAAGWNQTEDDWRRVMTLEPEGCFGIERDGRVVATATAVRYGRTISWIGMVLTRPDRRREGHARTLMVHSLEYLRMAQVDWAWLDATDMGRPLYEALGFQTICAIERWSRPPGAVFPPAPLPAAAGGDFAALDREAFGADRSALIEALLAYESAGIAARGCASFRPGARAVYFGPCVSRDPETAGKLLRHCLSRYGDKDVFMDLLPANAAALELARQHGFTPVRRLARMSLRLRTGAGALLRDDSLAYAVAGFEYG